jgi:hypothetical protein
MRPFIVLGLGLLLAAPAHANDSLVAESTHILGGMAWGAGGTWAASAFDVWPEHRVLVGVATATLAGAIGEVWDKGHHSGFSPLDVAVTAWGGLIGAVVTDQFILAPVATKPQQGGHYVGVVAQYKF